MPGDEGAVEAAGRFPDRKSDGGKGHFLESRKAHSGCDAFGGENSKQEQLDPVAHGAAILKSP